ncbi:4'-phosphopantetheinyl transferase superfamily protein [Candidatus Dependentiae bacterium]|nr:4'-phosphopantetheinyl transferase superfamily protein [Candidatus Dependentiae bacterium]
MIKGLGVDAVEIQRFIPWVHYPRTQLARIFSVAELDYCFTLSASIDTNHAVIAQRLALRFAAREAFFKALSGFDPAHTVPFLTVCRHVAVQKHVSDAISLLVDWQALCQAGLSLAGDHVIIHLSATHTAVTAFVTVIIEGE